MHHELDHRLFFKFKYDKFLFNLSVGVVFRIVMMLYIFYVIAVLNLKAAMKNLYSFRVDKLLPLIVSSVFLILIFLSNTYVLELVPIWIKVLYFTNILLIGLVEEFLCRIIIFKLFLEILKLKYIISAFFASFVFALFHYLNLFNQDFESTNSQVFYAFFMGVFLTGLFVKTKTIFSAVVFHSFYDAAFGLPDLLTYVNGNLSTTSSAVQTVHTLPQFITTVVIIMLLLVPGILMIRSGDKCHLKYILNIK